MSSAWKLTEKKGVGCLELDMPGAEVNVLTSENLLELDAFIDRMAERTDLKALMFVSDKERFFIAGADIKEIQGLQNSEDAFEKAEQGKAIFQKIESMKIPTLAVINGVCLGGGTELALACKYRVASFSEHVKIGLPEVKLGLLPGFGGSIRLPRLIGMYRALPLILSGRMLSAQEAYRNGLVDFLLPALNLQELARAWLIRQMESPQPLKSKKKKAWSIRFLEETFLGRKLLFFMARKDVTRKTMGHYPAPVEILNLMEKTAGMKSASAFQKESKAFAKLAGTEISKQLVRLFFLHEKYKKFPWTGVESSFSEVQKCGVVGAGVMGGGITQLVTHCDVPVRIKDVQEAALGTALRECLGLYKKLLKRKKLGRHDVARKMSLISTGLGWEGFRSSDFVIEAVVENLEIKQKVFEELSQKVNPEAILVTNTSALSVTQIAAQARHPERVLGMHFFNPVSRMPLVEVIRGDKTSDQAVEKTVRFARTLGKIVIVVEDSPGFLINRLLVPYLNEAAYLLEEGWDPESLDRLAMEFGMPMGPIELVDHVGIDVGYKVAHVLQDAFGERMKISGLLEIVKQKGLLGKKSGAGFYLYQGKKKKVNPAVGLCFKKVKTSREDALKRLIYVMVNEAARCLEEGIVDSAETVDIGMIMGTGFPPFRGGLLRYADLVGIPRMINDLSRFFNQTNRMIWKPSDWFLNHSAFYECK